MILPDINILIYAHRPESPWHPVAKEVLVQMAESLSPFALSSCVCSGFMRIVTNRRIFQQPTALDEAMGFVNDLISLENCRMVEAGSRHWRIMQTLLIDSRATANLMSDAYLAATAIENGCTLLTRDADFKRFKGLDLRMLPDKK